MQLHKGAETSDAQYIERRGVVVATMGQVMITQQDVDARYGIDEVAEEAIAG